MGKTQWAASLVLLVAAIAAATPEPTSYPGAVPPPPGVQPNLESPQDAGRRANIIGLVVCDVVVTFLFFIRTYVKVRHVGQFYLEDLTCTIAWALILLYSATIFLMIRHGEGYHSWDISKEDYAQMLKASSSPSPAWLYASSVVFNPAAFFTKATLLLLIARVFAIRQTASKAIHGFIIFILIAYIPLQSLKIAVCSPIRAYWDPNVDGKCFNQQKLFLVDLSVGMFTDLVILLVPVPLTWRLRVSRWKKFRIVLVLGAGGVATAMSILRLVLVVDFMKSKDVAADFVLLDLLTMLEIALGLTCSCLPSLNLLLKPYIRAVFLSNSRSTNTNTHSKYFRSFWSGGTTLKQPTTRTTNNYPAQAKLRPPQETNNYVVGALELSPTISVNGHHEGGLDLFIHEETFRDPTRTDVCIELARARENRPHSGIWDGSQRVPLEREDGEIHDMA